MRIGAVRRRVVRLLLTGFLVACAPADAPEIALDRQQLLTHHADLLRAHREHKVELWMSIEADSFISINNGRVTFPSIDERRDLRTHYFRDAEFEVYHDLREPIVTLSADRSLGWVIAEVEVRGTMPNADGVREPFVDLWAWIELYQKRDGRWQMVGNASNLR